MASTDFSLVRLVTAVLCRLQTFFSQILGSQAPNSRSFLPLTCRLTIVTLLHLLSRMFSLPRRLPAPISPLLRLPPRHGFAQFEPRAPTHSLTSCNRVQTAPRIREFLSPPRALHRCNMTSTTGNNKTTPIVLISTPTLHRLQRIRALIRRTPRRLPSSFHVRPRAQDWAAPGTSPVFSTLAAPPPHMRHCAHLWDSIDNSLKREMLRISFQDVERGLQEATAEAGTYATELADSEHSQHHDMLVRNATTITTSVHHTEATITTLKQDTRECRSRLGVLRVQEGFAAAAVEASSRTHQSFTAGFRKHPWTQHPGAASPAKMAPPPTRTPQASAPVQVEQQHATVDTRLTQAPLGGRSESPDTSAAVTSRRP